MNLALIADAFPPDSNSCATQLRDLSREFVRQGHTVTVLLPSFNQNAPWELYDLNGVRVLRLRCPRTKNVGHVRRAAAELFMPFVMRHQLLKSPLSNERWDAVVWYSPSIFHAPLVKALKVSCNCRTYLILRDIFPNWAADLGLMSRGGAYLFFSLVARYQYSVADVIGIQTVGNKKYLEDWGKKQGRRLQVLNNWLGEPTKLRCSIRVDKTPLAGRKLFLYAGNMGIAQGIDILLELARKFADRSDVGFLFVGRGSETRRLKSIAKERQLSNILFCHEVDPDEVPDLCSQCSVGLVALDLKHKSHNVPGKFIAYMQNSLPVLAIVNPGNDLASLIRKEGVGEACESADIEDLHKKANLLLHTVQSDKGIRERCVKLFAREFTAQRAVKRIISALNPIAD